MTDPIHQLPTIDDPNDPSTHQPAGSPIARLMATYPHLFQNGAPYWSDLPEGWYAIATDFMDLVDRHLGLVLAPHFRIDQCKEKFGGLRVYWSLRARSDLQVDLLAEQLQRMRPQMPSHTPAVDESPFDEDDDSQPPPHPLVAAALVHAQTSIRAQQQAILGRSLSTCQDCSAPGRLHGSGWMRTLCDVCGSRHTRIGNDS